MFGSIVKSFLGKIVDGILGFWRKVRISVLDADTSTERWHTYISPAGIFGIILTCFFFVFLVVLFLVAYTPILDIFPGYRTDAIRSKDAMVRNLIRIDSLEKKMNEMLAYNENVILVVEGKTPVSRTQLIDSISSEKPLVPPSEMDSILRSQMEGPGAYSIMNDAQHTTLAGGRFTAVAPISGIISEHFNMQLSITWISIAAPQETDVSAIADGTVIASDWIPDKGRCITVQHKNGIVSVYRHMGESIVKKGQNVHQNDIIGYTPKSSSGQNGLFEFEIWDNGRPVDPESYIVF
ncbi:MAG: M23 family metallopeptidase [Alistipes sp.]|nr:M23 family metallopeptidase [Candidatus Alistipes equi]